MRAEKVPEHVSWSLFSHSRKFPYKIFVVAVTWDHWITKFLIVFLQIKIQNYYV